MGKGSLETAREMLRLSTLAQLLFDGETLAAASPEAQRLLPGLQEGDTAEQIFGEAVAQYRRFQGAGSLLFTGDLAGNTYDITVTAMEGYYLVTAAPADRVRNDATLLSVAEQLRQPLAAMMAVSPKLFPILEESPDWRTRERTAKLNQGLYSLLRLASNLEQYAGPTGTLQFRRVELGGWLAGLAAELTPLLEAAERVLSFQTPGEACYCAIDETQLRRVLLALVSNAVKFSKQGSTVTLALQRSEHRIRILVRDQGEGIPADQMGLIFRRSEHRGTIPDPRWGVGVGLSVARSIVEAHSGRMMLESQVGVGTTVYVSLDARKNTPIYSELRTPMQVLEPSSGFNPLLVALADVLPAKVFDPRGTD